MPNRRKISSVANGETIENAGDDKEEDIKDEAEDVGQKKEASDDEGDADKDDDDNVDNKDDEDDTIPSAPPAEDLQEP